MRPVLLISLVWLLAAACASPAPTPATEPAPRELFRFRVGKWLNLHQRLYAMTSGWERGATARALRAEPPLEDPGWAAALAHYEEAFDHDHPLALLLDPELVQINRQLSRLGDEPLRGIDPALAGHLQRAAAAYEAWPEDAAENRAWIEKLEPALARHGEALAASLEKAYGARFPSPIAVDVTSYAGPVGAYTVLDPPHITITSHLREYQGDAALEMVFHEASHALVGPLREKLAAECARQGVAEPPQLWHSLLFYTTGEVVRRRLGGGYVPYADRNGLWTRGFSADERPIKDHWPAYLDGAIDIDTALARVVAALPRGAAPEAR